MKCGARQVGRFKVYQKVPSCNALLSQSSRKIQVKCSAAVGELPQQLQTLVGQFQMVPDPMARYKQLLFFAQKLDPLPKEFQTDEYKVPGCVSQVWVKCEMEDGKLYFQADSDAALTKGLAALLVRGLSGTTPQELVQIEPDFIEKLGLKQSLTPSRNNGFLNMFRLMQRRAMEFIENTPSTSGTPSTNGSTPTNSTPTPSSEAQPPQQQQQSPQQPPPPPPPTSSATPIASSMRFKLEQQLQPSRLVIDDNSHQHAGHAAARGVGNASGETHFSVEIVSGKFEGLNLVKRHRLVYGLLQEEFDQGLHALQLNTMTPEEAGK